MPKIKLSQGRKRSEIIASHAYGQRTVEKPAGGQLTLSDGTVIELTASQIAQLAPTRTPADGGPKPEAPTSPVDLDGNVDGDFECARPDCGHLASAHANTEDGMNTGACSMEDCACMAVQVDSQQQEEEGETPPADGPAKAVAAAGPQPADAPPDPANAVGEPDEEPELNTPPEVEPGANIGPAFSGVLVIEGQPTGDGREIAPDALTWRDPPLPLMGLKTETHDPNGFDMNDPAVMAGRIETLERAPGEGATQLINFTGHFFANEDGAAFAELTEQMGRMGLSADIAVQDSTITVDDVDDIGFPMEMSELLTEGTIMGATCVPFPAFQGCYIVLDQEDGELPEAKAIPQAAEAPLVPDAPPQAVAAGGQLIHLMAASECEACDQGLDVIVASGGPTRPPAAWFEDPGFKVGDGRLVEILGRDGRRDPDGKYACPLTVTDEGRVFGHIAPWNVCHTGKPGACVVAPRSKSGYAHFKRGQYILSAEGEKIRVGTITADTGHAPLRATPSAAMAHYDNTALQAADVNVGEDEFGIWVAGALRPGVTEQQVRNLTSGSLSGDWRDIGGTLELTAALAVPLPGFPLVVIDHDHGDRRAITAAGAFIMHRLKHPAGDGDGNPGEGAWASALTPLLPLAKQAAHDEIAALR